MVTWGAGKLAKEQSLCIAGKDDQNLTSVIKNVVLLMVAGLCRALTYVGCFLQEDRGDQKCWAQWFAKNWLCENAYLWLLYMPVPYRHFTLHRLSGCWPSVPFNIALGMQSFYVSFFFLNMTGLHCWLQIYPGMPPSLHHHATNVFCVGHLQYLRNMSRANGLWAGIIGMTGCCLTLDSNILFFHSSK